MVNTDFRSRAAYPVAIIASLQRRREGSVLIPAMAQLEAVSKVIRACPRNAAEGMKIMKWVYIHRTKPVRHPKLKEATV